MPGAAARTDTFGQRFVTAPAAEQEQWAHQGCGAGIAAADTQARTFSDTSTAYLRASALDFDDGLEESLQTTLGTVSNKDKDAECAIDSMLSRGLRAQSLSAGLVSGGTSDDEPERHVSEGVPAEHASQASLREQLRLARADRALAVGTRLNVPAPGAEDALYVNFKRKRIGGNQHTVAGADAQKRVVKLKGLEHWSVVGGVLYGRSSPFTLEDLLRQARDRDANGTEKTGEPSEEVARLLKAGAEDPVLRMTASVYEPDDGHHAWDHEVEDDPVSQSEPEAQSQPLATTGSDILTEVIERHLREHSSAVAARGENADLAEHLASHAAVVLGELGWGVDRTK